MTLVVTQAPIHCSRVRYSGERVETYTTPRVQPDSASKLQSRASEQQQRMSKSPCATNGRMLGSSVVKVKSLYDVHTLHKMLMIGVHTLRLLLPCGFSLVEL
jgi:hypothetical protein